MPEPDPVDLSPLDPRRDPAAWERRIADVLRDAGEAPLDGDRPVAAGPGRPA